MSTEIISDSDDQCTWKIISLVLIILTSVLFIISLLLWCSLSTSIQKIKKTTAISCPLPRSNGNFLQQNY